MGIGIIVCGLNGSGKSTLGKALSERIDGTKTVEENATYLY